MKDDLVGRVALVTGGGSGIGRGISLRFGDDGAIVAVLDVDGGRAASVTSEIKSRGGSAVALTANVGIRAEVQAAVAEVLEHYGRVDILVNNAGVIPMRGLFDMSDEIWAECFAINVTGVFLCSQIVSRSMIERSIEGRIVNIGSVESVVARRQQLAYGASKGAVLMLTKATALELADHRITVNAVGPGTIDSRGRFADNPAELKAELANIPLGRVGLPDDVAGLVRFLVSDDARYITGTIMYVDGGMLIE